MKEVEQWCKVSCSLQDIIVCVRYSSHAPAIHAAAPTHLPDSWAPRASADSGPTSHAPLALATLLFLATLSLRREPSITHLGHASRPMVLLWRGACCGLPSWCHTITLTAALMCHGSLAYIKVCHRILPVVRISSHLFAFSRRGAATLSHGAFAANHPRPITES